MSSLMIFEPEKIKDEYYGDASSIWRLDVFTPIKKCLAKGFKQSEIEIDVILTSALHQKFNATGLGSI